MYGKLENGNLIPAPKTISIYGQVHYHPSDILYRQCGFLPIEETPYPEVDEENPKYYAETYVEQDGKIVKVWIETELPEPIPQESTVEDKIAELSSRISAVEQNDTTIELALTELYEMKDGESNG